ncbi:MAG: MgtC/SapB family protein [Armatimonadota bacterium]
MTIKLILAGLLGGIVGYEREKNEHPAGLRTHMLVCLGSTLIVLISQSYGAGSDPTRIAAQIVSGIGFLGAGTILRQGNVVRGLTTAASLWTVAGIGMAVGVGKTLTEYTWLAVIATVIVMITLSFIRYLESRLGKGSIQDVYIETHSGASEALSRIINNMLKLGVIVDSIKSVPVLTDGNLKWRLRLVIPGRVKLETVVNIFASDTELVRFNWE